MGSDIQPPFRTSLRFPHMLSQVSSFAIKLLARADASVPPAIVLLLFAHYSDRLMLRWPFVFASLLSSAVGFCINISDAAVGVKYFGTFLCITGSYSTVPGVVAW